VIRKQESDTFSLRVGKCKTESNKKNKTKKVFEEKAPKRKLKQEKKSQTMMEKLLSNSKSPNSV